MRVTKTWLSMRDDRVRDDHVVADGQTRGLDEPFVVGGNLMQYPGDPVAPLEQTVNCRCTLVYTLPGDELLEPWSDRPIQDPTAPDFDPTTGQLLGTDAPEPVEELPTATLRSARPGTQAEEMSWDGYTTSAGNEAIQSELRQEGGPPSWMAGQIEDLDAYVARGQVTEDGLLYRGIVLADPPPPGGTIVDKGYLSTTTDRDLAERFAQMRAGTLDDGSIVQGRTYSGTPYVMEIEVRAGQPANVGDRDVAEWILPREATLEVVQVVGNVIRAVLR